MQNSVQTSFVYIMNCKSLSLSVSKTNVVSTLALTVQGSTSVVVSCCACHSFVIFCIFRYEKELQNEEDAYQQQRRRLYAEVQEEKERVASQASRQRTELDKLQRQLEDSHAHALTVMKQEYEKSREEQERRHSVSVNR